MRQLSMRLLEAASQGGFSRLGPARRCRLRFLRLLLEAGACEASLAARLGRHLAAGLASVAVCASRAGRARPRLSRRCWLSVLAAFAYAFACGFALRSSSVLAMPANRLRRSFLLAAPANCPLRWARVSGGVCPLLFHYLLLRRPALAVGAGSLTEFDHYLSITWLLPWPALLRWARGLMRRSSASSGD